MTEQNSALKYEQACNDLVEAFIKKYFLDEQGQVIVAYLLC